MKNKLGIMLLVASVSIVITNANGANFTGGCPSAKAINDAQNAHKEGQFEFECKEPGAIGKWHVFGRRDGHNYTQTLTSADWVRNSDNVYLNCVYNNGTTATGKINY